MTGSIRIRDFRSEDQVAVERLILRGLADHFGALDPKLNPDVRDIQRFYLERGHRVVVAELEGRIVGTGALVQEDLRTGRLVRMSVDRVIRGQGLGRRLVEHLAQIARERGYTALVCETNDDWFDAIGLYLACGFVETERRDGDIHFGRTL